MTKKREKTVEEAINEEAEMRRRGVGKAGALAGIATLLGGTGAAAWGAHTLLGGKHDSDDDTTTDRPAGGPVSTDTTTSDGYMPLNDSYKTTDEELKEFASWAESNSSDRIYNEIIDTANENEYEPSQHNLIRWNGGDPFVLTSTVDGDSPYSKKDIDKNWYREFEEFRGGN